MRWTLAVGAVLLLAGCSEPTRQDLQASSDLALEGDGDRMAAESGTPQLHLLADVNRSFANPTPPPSPESDGQEWVVAEIELGAGHSNLTFEFWREHLSANVWEPACRVYQGDTLRDEATFSDAGFGQTISNGTCLLQFKELPAGSYRAVYLDDGIQPLGTHQVRLRATGWTTAT